MALTIPSYPNKFNPAAPFLDAYAWVSGINLDIPNGTGSITLSVHPNAESWMQEPIDRLVVQFGAFFPPAEPGAPQGQFVTIESLVSAQGFAALGADIYPALTAHPYLRDASVAQ